MQASKKTLITLNNQDMAHGIRTTNMWEKRTEIESEKETEKKYSGKHAVTELQLSN